MIRRLDSIAILSIGHRRRARRHHEVDAILVSLLWGGDPPNPPCLVLTTLGSGVLVSSLWGGDPPNPPFSLLGTATLVA